MGLEYAAPLCPSLFFKSLLFLTMTATDDVIDEAPDKI